MDYSYLKRQVEKAGGICIRLSPTSSTFAVFIPAKFLGSTNRYPIRQFAPAKAVIVREGEGESDSYMERFDKTGFELWAVSSEADVDRYVMAWFGGTENVVR